MKIAPALAFAALLAATPALAVQPSEILPDPKLEQRARDLSAELRCMVCQNQSIDDSDAPLARDLRVLVREQLKTGKSDSEIRDFLVARYGDFILLKPPLKAGTLLLWGLPFAGLLLGALGIFIAMRRRAASVEPPLSPQEKARIDALLKSSD